MSMIRITKEFEFEMAHALYKHDGACKYIHGHSYKLAVTVIGNPLHDKQSPHNGMVIDFKVLKSIVKNQIIDVFDHALVLNADAPYQEQAQGELFDNIIKVPYQPTCENMVLDFVERIQKYLPPQVKLYSIKLNETATSYAEWVVDDYTS